MPSPERAAAAIVTALLAVGLACDDNQTVASRFLKHVLVPARTGGTVEITVGESRELAGTRLIIPPDALAADTTITVELIGRAVAADPAGPMVGFGPPGTAFQASPPLLALPANTSRPGKSLILEVKEDDGRRWTVPEAGMRIDAPNGLALIEITRLAAFQIGWRVGTPCIPITFSEGHPAAGQLKGIHSPLPRRPSMNGRMTMAGALAASCLLSGCQEPPEDSLEKSEQAARVAADQTCLQTCQLDASESLQRCLNAGKDRRTCSERHAAVFEACAGTCNAPCPPPLPPPPPVFPPPPPPPPALPPPSSPPPDPCTQACLDHLLEAVTQCHAARTDQNACSERAGEDWNACLNQCPPPAPPPPTPPPPAFPPPPSPPPDPCTQACLDHLLEAVTQCHAARTDQNACSERAHEDWIACLNQCPPPAPPPPPPTPPPPPPGR